MNKKNCNDKTEIHEINIVVDYTSLILVSSLHNKAKKGKEFWAVCMECMCCIFSNKSDLSNSIVFHMLFLLYCNDSHACSYTCKQPLH